MKTKTNALLVIVCILMAVVLALSVFALASAKSTINALEEENHALKAQIENMSVAQDWLNEEAYCTLVVADWSVHNGVLTANTFAQAILPDAAISDARIELRKGETVLDSQSISFGSGDAIGIYEVDASVQFDFPEIGADEELQLWLIVDSESAGLLETCGGGWYPENGEWMLITG